MQVRGDFPGSRVRLETPGRPQGLSVRPAEPLAISGTTIVYIVSGLGCLGREERDDCAVMSRCMVVEFIHRRGERHVALR